MELVFISAFSLILAYSWVPQFVLLFKDMERPLLRTWVEISRRAARKNYDTFRKIIGHKVKLWSVVKSNAYGHGLFAFSKLMDEFGVDGFCVDSIVEGLALRREGIRRPILVLGPTLKAQFLAAEKAKIAVSVSTMEDLRALSALKTPPEFHLKVDTGMHRRGFYAEDLPKVISFLSKKPKLRAALTGIFTHFASDKDVNYQTYTDLQFAKFEKGAKLFRAKGYKLTEHATATGGTLFGNNKKLDAVRIGIGLYGLWPSRSLEVQLKEQVRLEPALAWKAFVTETKNLKEGDFVGYDLTERIERPTKAAIIPVGYWHGFPRSLSGVGEVLIRGKRARVLGRVSMDLLIVDATKTGAKIGDVATLIGKSGRDDILATNIADRAGTSHYEYLTRLNPLMERRITD